MKKYLALILLLGLAAAFAACGDEPQKDPAANGTVGPVVSNSNDTPTLAYKRLFAAVKSKNIEAIKAEFSKASIATAQSQAATAKVVGKLLRGAWFMLDLSGAAVVFKDLHELGQRR